MLSFSWLGTSLPYNFAERKLSSCLFYRVGRKFCHLSQWNCSVALYASGIKLKEFSSAAWTKQVPWFWTHLLLHLCVSQICNQGLLLEKFLELLQIASRNSSTVWVGVSYTVQIIFTNNLSVCVYPHWLCASACTIVLQMNSLKCLGIHCWHLFYLIEIISLPSKLGFYDTSKLWNILFSILYKLYKLFLNFLF